MAKGQSNAINMTGKRFGMLTVIKRSENVISPNGKSTFATWVCKCDCGNVITARGYCLRNGNTTSCGCKRKSTLSAISATHKKSNTRIYKIWSGIKKRCNNPRSSIYKHYGGRGIKVCNEWENDFKSFFDWAISNGYKSNLSIDRKNVDKGYNPCNCRWVTQKEQMNNTRTNRFIEYGGMKKTISQWGEYLGESPRRISWRLNHGWSEKGALLGEKHYAACAGEIATEAVKCAST